MKLFRGNYFSTSQWFAKKKCFELPFIFVIIYSRSFRKKVTLRIYILTLLIFRYTVLTDPGALSRLATFVADLSERLSSIDPKFGLNISSVLIQLSLKHPDKPELIQIFPRVITRQVYAGEKSPRPKNFNKFRIANRRISKLGNCGIFGRRPGKLAFQEILNPKWNFWPRFVPTRWPE